MNGQADGLGSLRIIAHEPSETAQVADAGRLTWAGTGGRAGRVRSGGLCRGSATGRMWHARGSAQLVAEGTDEGWQPGKVRLT